MYDKNLNSFIEENLNSTDYYERFGFKIFGPYLFGLVTWLKKELEKSDFDEISFLARDGFMVKKAFDLLYASSFKSSYIYASRKSFFIPSLASCKSSQDLVEKSTPSSGKLKDLLLSLGVTESQVLSEKINPEQLEYFYSSKEELLSNEQVMLSLNQFLPDILENSKEQLDLLKAYFKQEGLSERLAILDIGWHGSLQKSLNELKAPLKLKNLTGYYTGIFPKTDEDFGKIHGFIFDRDKNSSYYRFFGLIFPVFETLFQPQKGTCVGFERLDGQVIPKLGAYPLPVEEQEKLAQIQAGALDFIEQFSSSNYFEAYQEQDDALFWLSGLEQVVMSPSLKDTKYLGRLAFEDDDQIHYWAAPQSLGSYLKAPKRFFRDFQRSWKVGFIKQLFKLPLAYGWLLKKWYKIK